MWLIRAYRDDDELALERSLGSLTESDLERRLGFVPSKLGSTPLDLPALAAVADILRSPIDAGLRCFLDFDADPQPASQEPSRLRMSA